MVDIKNIPAELKSSCRFCVWKFEKRNGQKTKMPYNPENGDRARINDLRTFADFKTTLVTYAMGGYDGIGIAVDCVDSSMCQRTMFTTRQSTTSTIAARVWKCICPVRQTASSP